MQDQKKAVEVVAERYGVVLKDKQFEAIMYFINGNDVFVTLPTGYGKSLIYALLPMVFDEIKGRFVLTWCIYYIALCINLHR